MIRPLMVGIGICLVLDSATGSGRLSGQMMQGSRAVPGGREAMSARGTPALRSYLEELREGPAGMNRVLHRLTIRPGARSYSVENADVSEALGLLTYSMRRPGLRLQVSGGPLRFTSDDTLSISGVSSLQASLELDFGPRDSLRVALRAPSRPASLSASRVDALASLGTATVDLWSIEFGTPAGLSVQFTHAQPLGGLTLSTTLAGDAEPRPGGTGSIYWRGTTARVGARISGDWGPMRVELGMDVSRSFADSLSGRNLFQGGGEVLARVNAAGFLSDAGETLIDLSAFYFRPYSTDRQSVAGLRAPVGDLAGASALVVWPLGDLFLVPVLRLSRESGEATSGVGTITRDAWSLGASLALDVPLGPRMTMTPELGYAHGSLRSELSASSAGGAARFETSDNLAGWWAAADFSVVF